MSTPERRHLPRTNIERLAYIQIEPNNGGIVLNVSEGGLCFHSIAPVERNGQMLFSILDQNQRIDARGELAWTDEVHNVAGVRFTTLTSEGREQVKTWMNQPQAVSEVGEEQNVAALSSAIFRRIPENAVPRAKMADGPKLLHATNILKLKTRLQFSGFSAGFASGIVISVLTLSALLFTYAHRRQFGESLIRLGERLATKSPGTHPVVSTVPPEIPLQPGTSGTQEKVFSSTRTSAQISAKPPKPQRSEDDFDGEPDVVQIPVRSSQTQASVRIVSAPTSNSALRSAPPDQAANLPQQPPTRSTYAQSQTSASNLAADAPVNTSDSPRIVHVVNAPQRTSAPPAEMYLDLGKFKHENSARSISNRLAELGLPTSVTQKGHFWMNSYHVVIGPLADDQELTQTRQVLLAHGYEPKPFERGSRNFFFSSRVTLNGAALPQGDITIVWDSFVHDALVKFVQGDDVLATAEGHWIPSTRKYLQDEFVYLKTADNSHPLLELHFYGSSRILVFRKAS